MIFKKKRALLLGALIAGIGLAGTAVLSQRETEENAVATEISQAGRRDAACRVSTTGTAPLDSTVPDPEEVPVDNGIGTAHSGNTTDRTITRYTAVQPEGIIGFYNGRELDNPSDNIFEVSLDQLPEAGDRVWLKYHLSGVTDYTNIPHSINDRLAKGGYLVKTTSETSLQSEELNPGWLNQGKNRVQFSLPGEATYGYKVSGLYIEVEKNAASSPLVINATQSSYNNKAYIKGFIKHESAKGREHEGEQTAAVFIDGEQVAVKDGEFEAIVPVNESRKAIVKVLYNGEEITRELAFTSGLIADVEYAEIRSNKSIAQKIEKGASGSIDMETAALKVKEEALLDSKEISITSLRDIDLPALNLGMSNVTGADKGYRFLPHGEHFSEGATVAIRYDRTKIPSGYTEDDIRTYYFDLDTKHWVALERDTIDRNNRMIVSHTTHFTDMINGVIQAPESPETQGFAPTMMTDIKAADPTSKLQLIAPPTANSRGTASLSYPFEMPPARNGMQPQLGLQYNSDGGSGWLGEGWDLNLSSITVDTRWGVPRYNPLKETETYLLDGSMLVTMDEENNTSIAHRGDKINRKKDRQFYPRKEGGFSRIIRRGEPTEDGNLNEYTWVVTDKSGTKYYYGRKIENDGVYPNPSKEEKDSLIIGVLRGTVTTLIPQVEDGMRFPEVITEWKLCRVEEIHGDYIDYFYKTEEEPVAGGLTATAIYLEKIEAGNKGQKPHTVIEFEEYKDKKLKKINNARYGFLTSSHQLLGRMNVKFDEQPLRYYTFNYKAGAFNANVLEKVSHYYYEGANGSNPKEFASHTFQYNDGNISFGPENTIELESHDLGKPFLNMLTYLDHSHEPSALGGSSSIFGGGSAYAGIGLGGNVTSKINTLGFQYAHSRNGTDGISTLVDINGDGLPDQVFVKGGDLYYCANNGDGEFSKEKIKIDDDGIGAFSKNSSYSNSYGGKAYVGIGPVTVSAGVDWNYGNSKTKIYFSDVNNDGLIDIVKDGRVYFNHIVINAEGKQVPTFRRASSLTPSPIKGGGTIVADFAEPDDTERENLVKYNPVLDVVRVWEAPYTGTVNIISSVQLLPPPAGYDPEEFANADGVHVAIQFKEGNNSEKWSQYITKDNNTTHPANVNNLSVVKGDKIYFRVQPGPRNAENEFGSTANGSFDQVRWAPVITYTALPGDAVHGESREFASNTFDLSIIGNAVEMEKAGPFRVEWDLKKLPTNDDIKLRITLFNDPQILNEETSEYEDNPDYRAVEFEFPYDAETDITASGYLECTEGDITPELGTTTYPNLSNSHTYSGNSSAWEGKYIKFELISQSNIALEKVRWTPRVITDLEEKQQYYVELENGGTELVDKTVVPASVTYSYYGQRYGNTAGIINIPVDSEVSFRPAITSLSNGKFRLAIKNENGLVKEHLSFTHNNAGFDPLEKTVHLPEGTYQLEYYTDDAGMFESANNISIDYLVWEEEIEYDVETGEPIYTPGGSVQAFAPKVNTGLGDMYRGWGQFVYNANDNGRYKTEIKEDALNWKNTSNKGDFDENDYKNLPQDGEEVDGKLESAEIEQSNVALISMVPDAAAIERGIWNGPVTNSWIKGDIMSASRMGEQHVIPENPLRFQDNDAATGTCGSTATAMDLKSETKTRTVQAGANFGLSGTGNTSWGDQRNISLFQDMNGDGYPDLINGNSIQFTNTRGGFDGEILTGDENPHVSKNYAYNIGSGGNAIISGSNTASGGTAVSADAKSNVSSSNAKSNSKSIPIDFSLVNKNEDRVDYTMMDVNGDGLPDRVFDEKYRNGDDKPYFSDYHDNKKKIVQLNLGYSFSQKIDYNIGDDIEKGSSYAENYGFGMDIGASSIQAGAGISRSVSSVNYVLMDINGDGLPDKVMNNGNVRFNLGYRFETEQEASLNPVISRISESESTSESINGAGTFGFTIFGVAKVVVNVGGYGGHSVTRSTFDLRDINGDGYLDMVTSGKQDEMKVRYSTIGAANKLKKVTNPLGGTIEINYDHSKATYDHPGGKWVMSSVKMDDKVSKDGANMQNNFIYENGKHDRHEREFLGFGTVKTINMDTESTPQPTLYRTLTQKYDVSNVYTSGSEIETLLADKDEKPYFREVKTYEHHIVTPGTSDKFLVDGLNSNDLRCFTPIGFTTLKSSKTFAYEGNNNSGLQLNEIDYTYHFGNNDYGDLHTYAYKDNTPNGNNYTTTINYIHKDGNILSLPASVEVKDANDNVLRLMSAAYGDGNNPNRITRMTQTLNEEGTLAVTEWKYDRYGNITEKILPENEEKQRMWYKYFYDRKYNMYVERIEDAFGYHSDLEDYDYRYGIPLTVRDMNGYTQKSEIDNLGRIISILAPNEEAAEKEYTMKFNYPVKLNGLADAYASTVHYDPQHPNSVNGGMRTFTFVDGMGRAIQVKKDTEVYEEGQATPKLLISGLVKYDPFGRTVESYYPATQSPSESEATTSRYGYGASGDLTYKTVTEYDIMDRPVKTTLPDNTSSEMIYSIDNNMLVATVIDAERNKQKSYTNGSKLTIKTEQFLNPADETGIITSFAYDKIGQLIEVTDAGENKTVSVYDMGGRRTSVLHPVSGLTTFEYDNLGNLTKRRTANIAAADELDKEEARLKEETEPKDKYIEYKYDFYRLTKIKYPRYPEHDITYTYGDKNASFNRRGRLALVEDATGAQEFFYGRHGEITKIRRTVVIPNQAIATYETQWKYDSWNRLTEMIYPDQEKVTYSYDTGGQLIKVGGEKAYKYDYVKNIGYDKFGQRVYMQYGNGSETTWDYKADNRRLQNLVVLDGTSTSNKIMDNTYTYDNVGNVTEILGKAVTVTGGDGKTRGGWMNHNYKYDGLYRLTKAWGDFNAGQNANGQTKTADYSMTMTYDNLRNITSKEQTINQSNFQFAGNLSAGYKLDYKYDPIKKHQIKTLRDNDHRSVTDESSKELENNNFNRNHQYEYDANGNLIAINIETVKEDETDEEVKEGEEIKPGISKKRQLLWDEENRLLAINDNGFLSNYWYDAGGERVIKTSGEHELVFLNTAEAGVSKGSGRFTAYINPYLVVSPQGRYTKHIYMGSQRIVSKLGDFESFGQDPRRVARAGQDVDGRLSETTKDGSIDYDSKYQKAQSVIKDRYELFELPYKAPENDAAADNEFCCNDNTALRSANVGNGNDNPEKMLYFYHSDHLGSTSLITDKDGDLVQHIEYTPFGEVFIEERNNTWNTPYLFNAKELDEETGLYYYSARYYDPRTSLFLSADPMQEKYPNISTYAYCFNNPVRYIDPTGMEGEDGMVATWNYTDEAGNLYREDKDWGPEFYDRGTKLTFLNYSEVLSEAVVTEKAPSQSPSGSNSSSDSESKIKQEAELNVSFGLQHGSRVFSGSLVDFNVLKIKMTTTFDQKTKKTETEYDFDFFSGDINVLSGEVSTPIGSFGGGAKFNVEGSDLRAVNGSERLEFWGNTTDRIPIQGYANIVIPLSKGKETQVESGVQVSYSKKGFGFGIEMTIK